jgi:hypothetical protein
MSAGSTGGARVLLVTLRGLNKHAAWCSNYEFEDVIGAVDDVDVLELQPGGRFELRQRIARSVAFRGRRTALARLNPGVKPVSIARDYDLMVFVCMNVWDLLYLNAVAGWQSRCRFKVCFMVETYAGEVDGIAHMLRLLQDFDHVMHSFAGSVEAVHRVVGRPVDHLPLASDVLRFTPFPDPPARVFDVFSMGRRSEPVHQALLRVADERALFYSYDTIPGPLVRPGNRVEHRRMLAANARRARFFITYPAKFGDAENLGQSDVGARYFEGAAAGAVLLGQAPTVSSFARDFPGPDAIVEARADGSDVGDLLASYLRRPAEIERLGKRNAVLALQRHDWGHRWRRILDAAGLAPRPQLEERLRRLESLAAGAERQEISA